MSYSQWLRRDAINRAWRSFWQSVLAGVLVAAGDAALQVLEHALATRVSGAAVDWSQVLHAAEYAAAMAALAPVLAYLHRWRLDPSGVPSLTPPVPPAR